MGFESRIVCLQSPCSLICSTLPLHQPISTISTLNPNTQAWASINELLGWAGSKDKWERGSIVSSDSNKFSLLFFVVSSWLWLQRRSGETHISERQGPCCSAQTSNSHSCHQLLFCSITQFLTISFILKSSCALASSLLLYHFLWDWSSFI